LSRSLRDFYRGLSSLLRAGVVIGEAIGTLRRNGTLSETLAGDLEVRIAQGEPLSKALAEEAGRFPAEDVALIEAGETSGRLVEMLERLAILHDVRLTMLRGIFRESLYPICLYHFAAVMLSIARPAALGRLTFANWLSSVIFFLAPLYVAAFLVYRLQRNAVWRARFRRVVDALPGFGNAARRHRRSVFASVLGATYEAGIPLDRGLSLAGRAAGLPASEEAAKIVGSGQTLTVALGGRGVLSPNSLSRLATSETAGEISTALASIAKEEADAADATFRTSMGALGKLIFLVVALWIAVSVILFWYDRYADLF
jgi:general secretion pathway protein F